VSATNVASLITSDKTWTVEGSPYTLTGPTSVNIGVTLIIEPGVTVNLNNYYLQVNGTLIAKGNSGSHIVFKNGQIRITEVSADFNKQTGDGNIFEYAVLDQCGLYSDVAIKVSNNDISEQLSSGNNSILTNNKITLSSSGSVRVGDFSQISDNTINGRLIAGNNVIISHNVFSGQQQESWTQEAEVITGAYCTISDNVIDGLTIVNQFERYTSALKVSQGSIVSNNIMKGTLKGSPAQVSGNTIEGGGTSLSWGMRDSYPIYSVTIDSQTCTLSHNTIKGNTNAAVSARIVTFSSNNIIGDIKIYDPSTVRNNTISGNVIGGGLFEGNRISGSMNVFGNSSQVLDNTVENGGIHIESGTVEHNLVTDGSGITTKNALTTIQFNTITKNTVGITVESVPPVIRFNNIEANTDSISLLTNLNVDAKNNWWGTTNIQTIKESIHDFKNDFNLGTVTIDPILTSRNDEAVPNHKQQQSSDTFLTPSPTTKTTPSKTNLNSLLQEILINFAMITIILGAAVLIVIIISQKTKRVVYR
jgi:hypothetical protein